MEENFWGGTVSLQGSIQALSETADTHRFRANKAEAKLTRIRDLAATAEALDARGMNGDGLWEDLQLILDEDT